MKKLNTQQIDRLFAFVRSKYVRYYDVQLELVDHLASAIEKEIEETPTLTFDQALQKVYRRFPITGFNNFMQEKSAAVEKYWRRRLIIFIGQYFRLPLIILTLGATALLFQLSQITFPVLNSEYNALSAALIIIILTQWIMMTKITKRINPKMDQELLSVSHFKGYISMLFMIPYQIILQFFIIPPNPNWASDIEGQIAALVISLIGVLILIIAHAFRTEGLEWIENELYNKYPEILKNKIDLNAA